MQKSRARVALMSQSAEEPLPLVGASMDAVTVTWSLCSMFNPSRALPGDEAISEIGFHRAWPGSGSRRRSLAAEDHSLEASRRRLPSRSSNRRDDNGRRVQDYRAKEAANIDLHVSGTRRASLTAQQLCGKKKGRADPLPCISNACATCRG